MEWREKMVDEVMTKATSVAKKLIWYFPAPTQHTTLTEVNKKTWRHQESGEVVKKERQYEKICPKCKNIFVGKINQKNCSRRCNAIKHGQFLKINDVWYKGKCKDCNKPIKGQYAKQCHECYWTGRLNAPIVNGKLIEHYHKAHYWIKTRYGQPKLCDKCSLKTTNARQFHWANISEEYKLIRSDWLRLCVSCHKKYDNERRAK